MATETDDWEGIEHKFVYYCHYCGFSEEYIPLMASITECPVNRCRACGKTVLEEGLVIAPCNKPLMEVLETMGFVHSLKIETIDLRNRRNGRDQN